MLQTSLHIDLHQNVARTLLYYDIFNYPLKSTEVYRFLGVNSISETDVRDALNALVNREAIFRFGDFYSIQANKELIARRLKGNKNASEFYSLALKQAKFISQFPFVKAVMASGSLSKDYMDDSCDLDFFIVTTPRRLWISRTILVLYKRLFLKNSHKYFCVNYFIDEAHLEIEEKNLFTATELATVLPLCGKEIYKRLMDTNHSWLKKIFPNYQPRDAENVRETNGGPTKRVLEVLLNIFFPDTVDRWCMNATLRRWKKLYGNAYARSDFDIAFKTKRHASKNHPRNFQKKVMEIYQQKVKVFNAQYFSHEKT